MVSLSRTAVNARPMRLESRLRKIRIPTTLAIIVRAYIEWTDVIGSGGITTGTLMPKTPPVTSLNRFNTGVSSSASASVTSAR